MSTSPVADAVPRSPAAVPRARSEVSWAQPARRLHHAFTVLASRRSRSTRRRAARGVNSAGNIGFSERSMASTSVPTGPARKPESKRWPNV